MRKRAEKNGAPPHDPTRKQDEGTERNDPTGETPNETRNGKRRKVIPRNGWTTTKDETTGAAETKTTGWGAG